VTSDPIEIAIIGGSGFYSLLDDAESVSVTTPYGEPSGELTVGRLGGRRVGFLPRHGAGHKYPPHLVPYRANLWALRSLGARRVISLSAVGSLRADYGPGTLVAPDQIADRTHGRPFTYNDGARGVAHVSFGDPYCPGAHRVALAAATAIGEPLVDGGVLVVVNGPRFSSRAESLEFQSHGWSIIGMTAMPEASLARELALCYTTLALVTDLDAGVEAGESVTHAQVLEQFAANLPRLRNLLVTTIERLPASQVDCSCGHTLDGTDPPYRLP
jgi:5'-methylthioadenosine phosphorylase